MRRPKPSPSTIHAHSRSTPGSVPGPKFGTLTPNCMIGGYPGGHGLPVGASAHVAAVTRPDWRLRARPNGDDRTAGVRRAPAAVQACRSTRTGGAALARQWVDLSPPRMWVLPDSWPALRWPTMACMGFVEDLPARACASASPGWEGTLVPDFGLNAGHANRHTDPGGGDQKAMAKGHGHD